MHTTTTTPLPLQTQSPSFGYLSPDASSDDGDSLQTPLTEHDEQQHHPYSVYHQHQHDFPHSSFPSFSPSQQPDLFGNSAKSEIQRSSFSSLSVLLTPAASEQTGCVQNQLDGFFPFSSPPSNALDLANASLEFNPFATSFSATFNSQPLSSDAPPFTPTKATFDVLPSSHSSLIQASSSTLNLPLDLPSLPSFSLSMDNIDDDDVNCSSDSSILFSPDLHPHLSHSPQPENNIIHQGRMYSPRFPADHILNAFFVRSYELGDELGAGGYGFVMTARHRLEGHEVAVKFIIKDKVPEHAWWEDDLLGRVPTEVMVMSLVNHENIVRCLDLFEDEIYFYLVQELHGTPWVSRTTKKSKHISAPGKLIVPSPTALSTPLLTPSPSSESNINSLPSTPPEVFHDPLLDLPSDTQKQTEFLSAGSESLICSSSPSTTLLPELAIREESQPYLQLEVRPNFSRRPSYDLFECIEQSKHKRLSENQARYVFAQVVDAVHYLDSQGITHCDIKDENLVVDSDLKVKLIDFGSAAVADPSAPRPYYTLFFGTTAYAASEILQKQPYRAAPAEIWTLGVLLSYLLTGHSPFPTEQDAIDGRAIIRERSGTGKLSRAAINLMARCLERDPDRRADIEEVRGHRWLQGALERGMRD